MKATRGSKSAARALRWAALIAPLLVACSSAMQEEPESDGGAHPDGSGVAEGGAASDGGIDGAPDATVDGTTDASLDSAGDASMDATGIVAACSSATLGPAGGTLQHPAGASIFVPAGALGLATTLTLCTGATTVPGALGQAFEASPEGQTFFAPVTVVLPFDATRVAPGTDLSTIQMQMAPHGSTAFGALESTVNLSTGLVTSTTTHFTQFIPAQTDNPVFVTSSPTLPQGTVGVAYTQSFTASGGAPPYTWSVPSSSSLPPGLALSAAGVLIGVPTVAGNLAFFVEVSDSASDAVEMAVSLVIVPPNNPVPTLTQATPSTVPQGNGDTTISLTGTSFVPTAQTLWDGIPIATTFVGSTQLAATIPAADLLSSGTHQVAVSNPAPGGGTSSSISFVVSPVVLNPVPSIASVAPTEIPLSSVGVQIDIIGTSFIPSSSAVIGAQGISTEYLSPTEVLAIIPATYLAASGTLAIGVYNPAPGGGFSGTVDVAVGSLNPTPTLTMLSPSSAPEGSAEFTLTLSGAGFVSGAQAFFGSTALATTYMSTSLVEATVPAYLLTSVATVSVVVVNPTPGGGASAPLAFAIEAPPDAGSDAPVDAPADAPDDAQDAGGDDAAPDASGDAGPAPTWALMPATLDNVPLQGTLTCVYHESSCGPGFMDSTMQGSDTQTIASTAIFSGGEYYTYFMCGVGQVNVSEPNLYASWNRNGDAVGNWRRPLLC